jgi:abortive infection bacteriophage resistance protein
MRNSEYVQSINRLKQILLRDQIAVSEKLKYINQMKLLQYKMMHRRTQLMSYLAPNMTYILNEYQGIDRLSTAETKGTHPN